MGDGVEPFPTTKSLGLLNIFLFYGSRTLRCGIPMFKDTLDTGHEDKWLASFGSRGTNWQMRPETVFKEKHGAWDPMPLCRFRGQIKHMYHGKPYGRVDLNPMHESTLSACQRLRIWPQDPPAGELLSCHPCPELVFLNLYGAQESMPRHQFRQPM